MKLLQYSAGGLLLGGLSLAMIGGSGRMEGAQEETYYYRKGEKVPLKVDASKSYVLFSPDMTQARVETATKSANAVLKRFETVKVPTGLNLTQDPPQQMPKWAIVDNIGIAAQPFEQGGIAKDVLYKAPFVLTADGKHVGMSHLVYVKLKDPGDKAKLETQAKDLKVQIVGSNKQMPLWYTLACTKDSAGNALQVANKLFESKDFAAAEPDFLADFRIKCADDAHFGKQWGLKNTGQNGGTAGIDIGICDAWNVATGKGVKVAVVDHGIQLDHPDLMANLSTNSAVSWS